MNEAELKAHLLRVQQRALDRAIEVNKLFKPTRNALIKKGESQAEIERKFRLFAQMMHPNNTKK